MMTDGSEFDIRITFGPRNKETGRQAITSVNGSAVGPTASMQILGVASLFGGQVRPEPEVAQVRDEAEHPATEATE